MSELKETNVMKDVKLNELTPKKLLNPTQAPKMPYQGPKSQK